MDVRVCSTVARARTADGLSADSVHVEVSGAAVLAADSPIGDQFVWALRTVGIDRGVLGSDAPPMGLGQAGDALERLHRGARSARSLVGRQPLPRGGCTARAPQ